jgi:3-oxoacyl-[acyl-carrier protein] reductase
MELSGRVAIVTGGARGIGAAIVQALWGAGAAVVIADLLVEAAQQLVEALGAERALLVAGDVAVENDVRALVSAAIERFGGLDILVNNAGISPKRDGKKVPVVELERDEWD